MMVYTLLITVMMVITLAVMIFVLWGENGTEGSKKNVFKNFRGSEDVLKTIMNF